MISPPWTVRSPVDEKEILLLLSCWLLVPKLKFSELSPDPPVVFLAILQTSVFALPPADSTKLIADPQVPLDVLNKSNYFFWI